MTENGVRDGIQRLIVVFDEPNSRESIVLDINDYFLENYEAELFISASRSSPWKERALERSALSILCDWHLLYIFIYTYKATPSYLGFQSALLDHRFVLGVSHKY